MQKIILTLAICSSMSACIYACNDEHIKGNGKIINQERSLSSFDKISLGGSIDMDITQGATESAVVETEENLMNYIITEVEGSTLKIHVKENYSVDSKKLVVHISCKQLKAVSCGGSGDVLAKSKITSDEFSISQGGSGDFNLQLAVQKLKISKAGSGDFHLEGSADELKISSAGSGDVDARNLLCQHADISSAGSGDVVLRKGTSTRVSSAGSGEVTFQ